MNRTQANELRALMGLPPIVPTATQEHAAKARKRAQAANRAAHAQLQRDLKASRGKRSK